jgi:benzodiazapine receptor
VYPQPPVPPAAYPPGTGWYSAPVWTVLYLLMAVAAWLVWRSGHARRNEALVLFAVQLVANAAWSPLFATVLNASIVALN